MPLYGLLVDYEYCCGCHTCEVACKQENNFPVGKSGVIVNEIITEVGGRIRIDYIPILTELCNLCGARTAIGELPSCVKHCMAGCKMYGTVAELAKVMEDKPRSVLFSR